jgi:hypothetical protein
MIAPVAKRLLLPRSTMTSNQRKTQASQRMIPIA